MNEYIKPNDILVSTILNPEASTADFINNGINSTNTLFLSPEKYKESEFIKKQFTDKDGKFDNELFNLVYSEAAKRYLDLTDTSVYNNINKLIKYNPGDIYAPTDALYTTPTYSIDRIKNPYAATTGLRSLLGTTESNKSARELAQKSKIFDTKTGKYLDKSAEDLGLLGGLFSTPLVYAKWKEDGTHYDEFLGREVSHKKGEYKTNADGQFYTETIGERLGYGEEFVALSDILTKEDSWLNKFDFFDSDDKDKSTAGVIMKTTAKIIPYLIPYFNTVWGGITAAVNLAGVLPTFAKMLEGLVVGDKETNFTRSMNIVENYFNKFDDSISDSGREKRFGLESTGAMIGDIFAQLYQMRAIASLSKLKSLDIASANSKAAVEFFNKNSKQYSQLVKAGRVKPGIEGFKEFWGSIASQSPEISAMINSQNKLARLLSLGYMAFLSADDVYQNALDGGYSRRVAGAAGLAAIAGQYAAMMSIDDRISSWFLDSVVGYNAIESKRIANKAILPLFERIKTSIDKLPGMSQVEKQKTFGNILSKAISNIKAGYNSILNGTSEFWSRSLAESIEEVTEEAILDLTKGATDALASFGLLGKQNQNASFGTASDFMSSDWWLRYAQNALGGFVGGSLFHLQEHYIENWIRGKKPEASELTDLIRALQNGMGPQIKEAFKSLAKADADASGTPISINNEIIQLSVDGEKTRGDLIAELGIKYIEFLEGLLNQYNANLPDDKILEKVVSDKVVLLVLKESNISELILEDLDAKLLRAGELRATIESLTGDLTPDLDKLLKDAKSEEKEVSKWIEDFLSGKNYELYLKAALAYLNPNIINNITPISLYLFAKAKTGLDWNDIPDTGILDSKESLLKDYEEYKRVTDKRQHIIMLTKALEDLEILFSPAFLKYAERYADIRKNVIDSVLSFGNFTLNVDATNKSWMHALEDISATARKAGLLSVTLNDIFLINAENLSKNTLSTIYDNNKEIFDNIILSLNISTEDFFKQFSERFATRLESFPINQWNSESFLRVLLGELLTVLKEAGIDESISNSLAGLQVDINTEDFAKLAIIEYINSLPELDAELVKKLKVLSKLELLQKDSLSRLFQSFTGKVGYVNDFDEDVNISLNASLKELIKNIISDSIDKSEDDITLINKLTDFIVLSIGESTDEDLKHLFTEHPEQRQELWKAIRDFLNNDSAADSYKVLLNSKNKNVISNPLFDLLRELSILLSPEVKTTIFDLLQLELTSLSAVSNISDYIKMPDVLEQIENAKVILGFAKAILAGMEDVESDFGDHLFGFNAQIKKFLDTYRKGENSDQYATINTQTVKIIGADLDLLLSKLSFIQTIALQNGTSKAKEDEDTKTAFTLVLIEKIKQILPKLTIKGVSILPPDDLTILDDEQLDPYVRLGRVEHLIYKNFHSNSDNVKLDLFTLFDNIINIQTIAQLSLHSFGMNKDTRDISEYDFFTWFVTVLGVDQNNFENYRKTILESLEETKIPLYIQELHLKVGYSFLNDSMGIHNIAVEYLKSKGLGYPANTENIMFVDGVSGSGKTTAVALYLLLLLQNKKIFVSAPNRRQVESLREALKLPQDEKNELDKEHLLRYFFTDTVINALKQESLHSTDRDRFIQKKNTTFGSYWCLADNLEDDIFKNISEAPDYIFIDEVTHFNTAELLLLNLASKKYGFKILTIGDLYLESSLLRGTEAHVDLIFTWKGPRLKNSIRPSNVNKNDNIGRFETLLSSYYDTWKTTLKSSEADEALSNDIANNGLLLKYFEDTNSLEGDKVVDDISVEDLNKLKRISSGPIGIIADLDDEGNLHGNSLALNALIEQSDLTDGDYVLYSNKKIHNQAVLGAEAEYFVIYDSGLLGNEPLIEQIKKIYTFLTRSLSGSILRLPNRNVNINSLITGKPGVFKLAGIGQRDEIIKKRIDEINLIVSNPILNPDIAPIQAQELLEVFEPKISSERVNEEDQLPELEKNKIYTYSFYSSTGLSTDNGLLYTLNSNQIPIDLLALERGRTFSKEAILGFTKLKRLILLLDISDIQSTEFTNNIATFLKELFPEHLRYFDNSSAIQWLKDNLVVEDDDYLVATIFGNQTRPVFTFGYNRNELVQEGRPILMTAKKVKLGTLETYFTTTALAKSSTIPDTKLAIKKAVEQLENNAALELLDKDYIVHKIRPLSILGNKNGRLLYRNLDKNEPEFFDSISLLKAYGVNVKEVKLITSKQKDGKYLFLEWAKQIDPTIEKVAYKNGKFNLSGRYYARLSYTANGNDRILILDLNLISEEHALKELKLIKGNLQEKLQILHSKSYVDLAMSLVSRLKLIGINRPIENVLTEFLAVLNKNESIHTRRISLLKDYLNLSQPITYDNLKLLLLRDGGFGALFTDFLINSVDSVIHTKYGDLNFDSQSIYYQNVSPADIPNQNGVCPLVDFDESKLGLRNEHFEPPIYLYDILDIIPLPQATQQQLEKLLAELTDVNNILDVLGISSDDFDNLLDDDPLKEMIRLISSIELPANVNLATALQFDGENLLLDPFVINTLGEDFKQQYENILRKQDGC